jgi:hypothetical protein
MGLEKKNKQRMEHAEKKEETLHGASSRQKLQS